MALDLTYPFGPSGHEYVKEHQLQNMWLMTFYDFEDFDLYIQDTTLPLFSLSTEKIELTDLIIPTGKEDYSDFSITFYETVDWQGYNYHKIWLNKLYDFEKKLVRKTFHSSKKNASIEFISQINIPRTNQRMYLAGDEADTTYMKNKTIKNKKFLLKGIQLVGISDISLSNESGEPLSITCNYQVQNII